MASMVLRLLFNILCFIDRHQYIQLTDKKQFYIFLFLLYCLYKQWVYIQFLCIRVMIGGKMQDYLLESLKLQRIDFFIKLVAASECSDEEKRLAIQWVSELTDELMAKIRSHEYSRSTEVSS
ncbi:hypothetical protein ESCOMA044M1_03665 [Escherichia coli]|nr:hypothetical protein YKEC1_2984 [Escherichia coli]KDG80327.1 hypothetical protein AE12_00631 [Escherichia coli UCI 53]SSG11306.1 Uncharacterised protein [Klebsiella pneumoniae]DAR43862.1 MAG TPA: hypothetical protein [Caudoviricetes sp.]OAC08760.1 hypothetical protein RIKO2305_97c00340 [Escherichia coli]